MRSRSRRRGSTRLTPAGTGPHAGVSFTVNGVTKQTDANGKACFDGLTFAAGRDELQRGRDGARLATSADAATTKAVTVNNAATLRRNAVRWRDGGVRATRR